jgi:DNA repair protein RadC
VRSQTVHGPRERALEEGIDQLGDAELLALVLGTGTRGRSSVEVAASLLDVVAGAPTRTSPHVLAQHPGLGHAKALRLAASLELGRRMAQRASLPREPLRAPSDVAAHFRARLGGLPHEEMFVASLDGRNGVRAVRRVALGGLHGCAVTARDILRNVLADAASAFVLVHNHPSGDPTPSLEDLRMTERVAEAANAIGVPLVDHVIVAAGGHASLLDRGDL